MEVNFKNNSQHYITGLWDFGDSFTVQDSSPVHHYQNPGSYNVVLIALTDSGCTDTATTTMVIPPLPKAGFSYSIPTCDSVMTIVDHSQNATSWHWDFGDEKKSDDQSPIHIYELSGNLSVFQVVESDYGCIDSSRQDIFFISRKRASFDYFMDTCSGVLQLRNGTLHAYKYLWNFDDGDTSTLLNPVHRFSKDGEHEIILTVNPETACMDSTSRLAVYKTPLGEIMYAPNSFTPNGDGINDVFNISLYRPCDIYSLKIFNRWGQLIYETDDAYKTNWDGTYKGDPVQEGVYVYLLDGAGYKRKGVIYLVR